jgi:pimeloyl-ACP methyl ester carboxylesterase
MSMENQTRWQIVRRICRWFFRIVGVLIALVFLILIIFYVQANRRESKIASDVAPNTGKFINANDLEIFIQEAGPISGQPVLLIHGTGAWSEIWRETMSVLAENGFRAIAIDVPPFGYSEKPDGPEAYSRKNQAERIIGILDTLNIKKIILVGHSVGGRPTIEVALEAPDRVQKLILVDPALGFLENSDNFQQNNPSWIISTLFEIRPLRKAVLATYGTNPLFTKKLFKSFVSNVDAVTEPRVKMLQQPLVVQNTTDAYGDWLQYLVVEKDTSLASDFSNFSKLKMPVSIIWGSTDTVTPLWQGEALKKLIPNSELTVIDGVGHIPYIENAPKFNEILLKYLNAQR